MVRISEIDTLIVGNRMKVIAKEETKIMQTENVETLN